MRRAILAVLVVLVGTLGAMPAVGASAAQTGPMPKQFYLSLGDSVAFGFQQARLEAEAKSTGTVDPKHFTTGYSDDLWRMLRALNPSIQLVNFGCPGETSTEFISSPGCPSYPFPLHNAYSDTQLGAALAFIKAHPGQVSPITVDLGANDVNRLISSCGGLANLTCVAAGFPATAKTFGQNLAQILGALRQAAPDASITVLQLYNPYIVAAPASGALADAFNKVIAQVATATHVNLADAYTPFNVAPPQPQTLCTLTAFCGAIHDIHPTDAGYLKLAQLFYDASGFAAGAPGFVVSWTSTSPGQGEVYFGTGPGCKGLVSVATQDLFPNGTAHTVLVSGNDMPGTVGDAGILPGTTYYYEYVTITRAGMEIDNNGGACYSLTTPK